MGFKPTRGDPIGLAGRRLDHSAKVSSALDLKSSDQILPGQHSFCSFWQCNLCCVEGLRQRSRKSSFLRESLGSLIPYSYIGSINISQPSAQIRTGKFITARRRFLKQGVSRSTWLSSPLVRTWMHAEYGPTRAQAADLTVISHSL